MNEMHLSQQKELKILLLGKNGQVGWELQKTLAPIGEVIATDRKKLDMTDYAKLRETIRALKPNVIVNATAYTAVEKAETEPDLAMVVNGTVPAILAKEAKKLNSLLVHYSTDYVFDGTKKDPYTEEDVPNPLNVYGRTKLAGEEGIRSVDGKFLIFRTSWVYGTRGYNFYLTIQRLAREKEEISVVDDQIGAPTWCRVIAESTAVILAQKINKEEEFNDYVELKKGLYHMTASGQTSWYEFAQKIMYSIPYEERRIKRILPIKTEDYSYQARRPLNSVMNNNKFLNAFGAYQKHWADSLDLVNVSFLE